MDDKLCAIAADVQSAGETDWLVTAISTMTGRTVLDHAKALVLAGELDAGAPADALWRDTLLPRPLPRWLGEVRALSWRRYRANAHAKLWLERFTTSRDPIEAFSAFELFRMTAERSCTRWPRV
ncbi:MAG: hypothetical protein JWR80_6029 [Bradyrhizobium sp.]|nr:hypothetical protein [Bradyrhizobium sp.]